MDSPLSGVKVRCLGNAGIIDNVNKWIAVTKLVLHSPEDGFNNVNLVMYDIHLSFLDSPEDGNDFICEVTLVPESQLNRGATLLKLEDVDVALIRELWDSQRVLENSIVGVSNAVMSVGSKVSSSVISSSYINNSYITNIG
jgi:hypothetical protein